jgi:hypothetical protein
MKDRINIIMDLRERGCGVNRKDKYYSDSVPENSRSLSFAVLQFCLYVRELM